MKLFLISLFILTVFITPLQAEQSCDAQAIYEKLAAETTGDVANCSVQIKEPKINECPQPKTFTGGLRPASHVVFLMDASGSMAGQLAGKSKMACQTRIITVFTGTAKGCSCRHDCLWA